MLHREGVYHRDIAPDNVLVSDDAPPVLLDFGAARRVISDRNQTLTAILKPSYAPLEQYAESTGMRQGPWTDFYALGATLHYLITGKAPMPATARAVSDEQPRLAGSGQGGVPDLLLQVCDWMLAPAPQDRPQNVAELRAALAGQLPVPQRARRSSAEFMAEHGRADGRRRARCLGIRPQRAAGAAGARRASRARATALGRSGADGDDHCGGRLVGVGAFGGIGYRRAGRGCQRRALGSTAVGSAAVQRAPATLQPAPAGDAVTANTPPAPERTDAARSPAPATAAKPRAQTPARSDGAPARGQTAAAKPKATPARATDSNAAARPAAANVEPPGPATPVASHR